MPTQGAKLKLTAILIADVKGYSRLMGEDEVWAVQTLSDYKEVMVAHIQELKGRLVQAVGDNILAEFGNAVDAVQCAVEAQRELKIRNRQFPVNRRMEFRIGVNVGDVIEEGDKLSGDGVTVTAKMESLSAPGGICISGAAYDYVKKRLVFRYEYLGEQSVKNIEKPVRVYRVLMEPKGFLSRISVWKGAVVKQWERLNPVVKVIIAVAIGANALWQIYPRIFDSPLQDLWKGKMVSSSPDKPSKAAQPGPLEVASKEKMAFPLPDLPSIAVLPFDNMNRDPKEEFFSDGITESIITALSKVPRLFVIARNSTFTYKGKPVKVKQVSEELGVRYVLEGSVQRSGDRVRVTAQLIDALTGHHLWAERYDRDLKNIFALQDEITLKVLTAIRVKVTEGELPLGSGKYYRGKQGLDCYLKIMESSKYHERFTIEANSVARRLAEEAIAMCPENPSAYSVMASVLTNDYWLGTAKSPREVIDKAIELLQQSIGLDDTIAETHGKLSDLYTMKREHEKAIAEGERAVALNPSGAIVHMFYGMSLNYACRHEEAIPFMQKAIRLNPIAPNWYYLNLGHALRAAGRFEEAVSAYRKVLQRMPDSIFPHTNLAGTYSMMGRENEARAEAAEVLRINPKFSLDYLAKTLPYKEQSVSDNYISALRKAGLK